VLDVICRLSFFSLSVLRWLQFAPSNVESHKGKAMYQVFDRKTKLLVEELIDNKIVLSMRAIYQSKAGLALMDTG
jgi:hypothetical protein